MHRARAVTRARNYSLCCTLHVDTKSLGTDLIQTGESLSRGINFPKQSPALRSLLRLQKSDGPFFVNQVASAIFAGSCALSDQFDDLRGCERRVERK